MDYQEKLKLEKMYEQDVSDKDLIEMALAEPADYEPGVYSIVIKVIKSRGLQQRLEDIKKGASEIDGQKWIEVCRFSDSFQRSALESLFKDKKIEIEVIANATSVFNSSGSDTGRIRVRDNDLDSAREALKSLDNRDLGEGLLIDDGIREAVINVLKRRGIDHRENIADEIIKEIGDKYEAV